MRVYLDPTALTLPGRRSGVHASELVAPGASEAIDRILDAGIDVVVLGECQLDVLPDGLAHEPSLPERLEADAWFLTGVPHPAFGRPRGGMSVLVGPRQDHGPIPSRFDLEARDLLSATIEVLTRQAMS